MPYAKRINPCGFILRHSIGGFSLGLERAGFKTVVFCEQDKFCQKVLKKHWPGVPIEPDIKTFDGKKYAGSFILTAGTPCQPASCAGKRRGTKDDRWLWGETFRVVAEVKPKWCILENVRGLLTLEKGLVFDNLLSELEAIGYETTSFIIPACAVNAPHRRDRVWIVANRRCEHGERSEINRKFNRPLSCEENAFMSKRPTGNDEQGTSPDSADTGIESLRKSKISSFQNAVNSHPHRNGLQEPQTEQQADRDRQLDETSTDTESPKCELSINSRAGRNGITGSYRDVSDALGVGLQGSFKAIREEGQKSHDKLLYGCSGEWSEPWIEVAARLCTLDDGLPNGLPRPRGWRNAALKAVGNAVVPQIPEIIGRAIMEIEK